jgi:hypothetical protein
MKIRGENKKHNGTTLVDIPAGSVWRRPFAQENELLLKTADRTEFGSILVVDLRTGETDGYMDLCEAEVVDCEVVLA